MAVTFSDQLRAAREQWTNRGQKRPSFADEPADGQESVWDYPRPPALVEDDRQVRVSLGETLIASSSRAVRVLETASPPTVYIPRADVDVGLLQPAEGGSLCEWKGEAQYFDVTVGLHRASFAAWSYPDPFEPFADIANYLSFYPGRLECWLGGERVRAQPGGFYGGWVTDELVGPFKGGKGTGGW